MIKGFTKSELMRWPKIEEVFKTELGKIFVFDNTPQGAKRWSDFRERVIEFVCNHLSGDRYVTDLKRPEYSSDCEALPMYQNGEAQCAAESTR